MQGKAWLIAGVALAGLAACSDGGNVEVSHVSSSDAPARVASRLDCPEREGDLRLVSAAADGRPCAYRTEDGAQVELRLTGADGAAELASLETELRALVPAAASAPEPLEPPAPPEPPEPAKGWSTAEGGSGEPTERTKVRLPGLSIETEGDRASVRMPGMRVEADGDKAQVRMGGGGAESVTVDAHDGGAEIRTRDDDDGGLRSMFLVASETPGPAGWRVAGYQARGAQNGPAVVGVVRSREEKRDGLMDDVDDLVRRNVEG